MRAFDRDLIRGGHYGQRSCEPRKQAEHMAAPTNLHVMILLANPEPSTHGPKRTFKGRRLMSAMGQQRMSADHLVGPAFYAARSTAKQRQVDKQGDYNRCFGRVRRDALAPLGEATMLDLTNNYHAHIDRPL